MQNIGPSGITETPAASRNGALLAAAVLVLFSKLWLIAKFGSSMPFWDEWDAQGDRLFLPYAEHRLGLIDLLQNHNEHRIFFGRILWLFSLQIEGIWDTIGIMVLNSVLHTAVFLILMRTTTKTIDGAGYYVVLLAATVAFSLPLGYENTLWAMQSVVYLLVLFSILALVLTLRSPAFSWPWIAGTGLSVCSYLSMAAGAVTLAPVIVISAVQLAAGARRGVREYVGMGAHFALILVLISLVPTLEYKDGIASTNFTRFAEALVRFASWPLTPHLLAAIAMNLPTFLLVYYLWRQRSLLSDFRWPAAGAAIWTWAHIAVLAYGRSGSGGVASRYVDIVLVGLVVNLAIALAYFSSLRSPLTRVGASSVVVAGFTALLVIRTFSMAIPGIEWRSETSITQARHVSAFLTDGDVSKLRGYGHAEIPYPSPERLAHLLSRPALMQYLPPRFLVGPDVSANWRQGVAGLSVLAMIAAMLAFFAFAARDLARRRHDLVAHGSEESAVGGGLA